MKKNTPIGEKLKYIRKTNNLNLENIALILGVTPTTISRYEKGIRTPDNEVLELYGKQFNLNGNWLLYGESPIIKTPQEEKDIRQAFLELANELPGKQVQTIDTTILKESLEKITEGTPENYLSMLSYMMKDERIRRNIFQFFFLFLKTEADNTEK